MLLTGLRQANGIGKTVVLAGVAQQTHHNFPVLKGEGGHQAVACRAGVAGFHANRIGVVVGGFRVDQQIVIFPNHVFAGNILGFVSLKAHIAAHGFAAKRQLCNAGQIIQAGIMGAAVPAVGVGEMALLKAQHPRLPVHFIHKGLYRIGTAQGFVPGDGTSRGSCQHHGRIIAAGEHHTLHQHMYLYLTAQRGALVHQIKLIGGGDDGIGVQILQRHVGGKQLCDTGGEELAALHRFGIENCIGAGIKNKNVPCLHIPGHAIADLIDGTCCVRHMEDKRASFGRSLFRI